MATSLDPVNQWAEGAGMEPLGSERHRWADREVEWSFWDIEGKTAREAATELGKERVSNEREQVSQWLSLALLLSTLD